MWDTQGVGKMEFCSSPKTKKHKPKLVFGAVDGTCSALAHVIAS